MNLDLEQLELLALGNDMRTHSSGSRSHGTGPQRSHDEKRRQYQACDACRLRRIKCERQDETEPCKACSKRGFACTKIYNSNRATELRTGRLINQAEALYGNQQAFAATAPMRTMGNSTMVDAPIPVPDAVVPTSESSVPNVPLFSQDSADARMEFRQSNDFVIRELIECYRNNLLARVALGGDFDGWLARWDAAGRFDALTRSDQAIGTLIVALAARVSDLPIIAGPGCPRTEDIRTGAIESSNLAKFGFHRETPCRALEEKARRAVGQTFCRATATIDSISTLVAMQSIDDLTEPIQNKPRVFSAAAVEQLRSLALKPNKTQYERWSISAFPGRAVLVTDSLWGFRMGRVQQITEEDLILLYPGLLTMTHEDAVKRLQISEGGETTRLLMDQLILQCRKLRKDANSPIAKYRNIPPSPAMFYEQLGELEPLMAALQRHKADWSADMVITQAFRANELAQIMMLIFLRWYCDGWTPRVPEEQQAALRQASADLTRALANALPLMADTCRSLVEEGMVLGKVLMWMCLQEVADLLLDLPIASEGGKADFTLSRKVECVNNVLRCVRQLAFSWPQRLHSLPHLEDRLNTLQQRLRYENQDVLHSPSTHGSSSASSPDHEHDFEWLTQAIESEPETTFDINALLAHCAQPNEEPTHVLSPTANVDDVLNSLLA